MNSGLTFGELKKYLSKTDRISICQKETGIYENYRFLRDVPDKYDCLYIYGVGIIESEFPLSAALVNSEVEGKRIGEKMLFAQCLEIVVQENPKG